MLSRKQKIAAQRAIERRHADNEHWERYWIQESDPHYYDRDERSLIASSLIAARRVAMSSRRRLGSE